MENIIIIGGGPAGISAALYAARSGRDPLVIEHGAGGLKKAEKIENYYGGGTLSGQELYDRGIDQAKTLGVRILTARSWAWKASIPSRFTPTRAILTQRQ